jgi:hypothetical protein
VVDHRGSVTKATILIDSMRETRPSVGREVQQPSASSGACMATTSNAERSGG